MKEIHIHLHLDRELLANPSGSIHIHLTGEGHGAGGKPRRRRKPRFSPTLEGSGLTATAEPAGMHSQTSGIAATPSGLTKSSLAVEQRIRSKMYRLDLVPSAEGADLKRNSQLFSELEASSSLILELATSNQVSPIVWESCEPKLQRGLWRLSVRDDFGRLLGIVTHARDRRAIWIVSDWTPRGTLIVEPADPQSYPRLMLTPVPAFQR